MIKFEDLQLIWLLAQETSIAAAARKLNLTPSAVSQRLSAFEDRTGLVLAHRNGRSGIALTDDGAFVADRASHVLSEIRALQDELGDRRGIISGHINVVAPFGFGRRYVAPLLGRFGKQHSRLSINLRLSDDLSSIPSTLWDILIRVAPVRDSSLVSTVLSQNKRLICASPSYVQKHGQLKHPKDLKQHRCISISEDGLQSAYWTFQSNIDDDISVKVQPYLTSNDGETALEWAISGLGVVVRSEWSAAPAIRAGQLIELTPAGWSAPDAPILALTTARNSQSARVSAVLEYLAANLGVER